MDNQKKVKQNNNTDYNLVSTLNFANSLADVEINRELITSEKFAINYEQLITLSKYLDDLKKTLDTSIKNVVKDHYYDTGENSVSSDKFKYVYIPETTRESFNSKGFKKDNPEIYKQYVTISSVSDSVKTYRLTDEE